MGHQVGYLSYLAVRLSIPILEVALPQVEPGAGLGLDTEFRLVGWDFFPMTRFAELAH